jgi:hypothetical protein
LCMRDISAQHKQLPQLHALVLEQTSTLLVVLQHARSVLRVLHAQAPLQPRFLVQMEPMP